MIEKNILCQHLKNKEDQMYLHNVVLTQYEKRCVEHFAL